MKNDIIERFGGLLKEELFSCIENEILLKDTCVLESLSPFAGYYMKMPGASKPRYVYLMLDGPHTIEHISRSAIKIRNECNFNFDAVLGTITFKGHQPCPAIRIRDLEKYEHIALLQKHFKEEGIQFKKKSQTIDNSPGLLRLEKMFFLEPMGHQMYFDRQQPHHGYFVVPQNISWKKFCELTVEVKFETDLLYFDAAQAFILENNNIIDLVRIYREHLTLEKLAAIQKRYLKLFPQFAAIHR